MRKVQIRPRASIDKDNNARRLICLRVGGGAFERFATRSMGDDDVVSGAPQPMHTAALSLTARPHSLHAVSAMILLPSFAIRPPHRENQRITPNRDQGAGTVDLDAQPVATWTWVYFHRRFLRVDAVVDFAPKLPQAQKGRRFLAEIVK